ncbi:MAG TPA: RraA family protein [Ktedonobacterales bacterium]|nr:RraA family protein [Ktedonobacterales bacterium]
MTHDPAPDWLAATLAADAAEGQGALPLAIRPLAPAYRIAGRVTAVTIATDDNLDLRQAMPRGPQPGPILLVAGGAASTCACMGGLMAREMRLLGFTALITDAPVRDAAEVRASGLLVWSRGLTAVAPGKRGGGHAGEARFGDVIARDGDFIIADEDGVIVWPWARYDELLARARTRLESDKRRARELDAREAESKRR